MQMNTSTTIQSGRPSGKILIGPEAQQDVLQAYLASMRQRFKIEINRLTGGDMLEMLRCGLSKQAYSEENAENLCFLMTYIYAWNWLQQNVHSDYQHEVLETFSKGPQGFLMNMLLQSNSTAEFIQLYIKHWKNYQGQAQLQHQQLMQLLKQKGSVQALADYIESVWQSLHLFSKTFAVGYKDLAKQEKDRYADMLGPEDKERLALVDQLPDTEALTPFSKLGIIPAMGCPQTCRHCMFIFRPLMKNTDDPTQLV